MIATPKMIRDGIAANIKREVKGLQVLARPISSMTPPACYVATGPTQFHKTMGRTGHSDRQFIVVVFVALTSDNGAQELLDEFTAEEGARSIFAAIESDKTLGGIVDDVIVRETAGAKSYTFDTLTTGTQRPPVLGDEFTVSVMTGNH